jgi:hypothetical protein
MFLAKTPLDFAVKKEGGVARCYILVKNEWSFCAKSTASPKQVSVVTLARKWRALNTLRALETTVK